MKADKQTFNLGDDGWCVLDAFIKNQKISSVLLVTGKKMFAASGAQSNLEPILKGLRVRRISDFESNPKAKDIQRIRDAISKDTPYDAILAVGGGSVIDVSKLLKAYWNLEIPIADCIQANSLITPTEIPLIALPTTAGSGSEATHFAVVYHAQKKFSIAHTSLRPDLAIIIPSLLNSLPTHIAAASGIDALCQGIESYWSIHSTETSRTIAQKAIALAWSSLEQAVTQKTPKALTHIAQASYLAGQAINLTKTTAPHAVSYALTTFYGIAHGHAVGLLLPHFLSYNAALTSSNCLDPRGTEWVDEKLHDIAHMLGHDTPVAAGDAIMELMSAIGLVTNLTELGISTADDVETIVSHGFNPQRVNNNPRRLTETGLRTMLMGLITK